MFNELISTSKAVSVNNSFGTREGQTLPKVRKIMFNDNRWNEDIDFNWKIIKCQWLKYWDITRPILLEKSPPNIIRAQSLRKVFNPSFFIVFYRNPYAHCESLMRRENYTASSAAEFAIQCLKYQMENILHLPNHIQVSYEHLVDTPEETIQRIQNFVPELKDLNHLQSFSAHNYMSKSMGIENLNTDKINKLAEKDIKAINQVFSKNLDVLNFFEYDLVKSKYSA